MVWRGIQQHQAWNSRTVGIKQLQKQLLVTKVVLGCCTVRWRVVYGPDSGLEDTSGFFSKTVVCTSSNAKGLVTSHGGDVSSLLYATDQRHPMPQVSSFGWPCPS